MNASTHGAPGGEESGRWIMFFEKHYTLYAGRLLDDCGGAPGPPIADLIRRYLLAVKCVPGPLEADWCSFRELRGAGPLAGNFAANTHKTIVETFGNDLCALDCAAAAAAGLPESGAGFDRRYRFQALAEVPLILNYNASEDLFPAQAQLLFPRAARFLLDVRDLFTLGTYLTGRLVAGARSPA